MVTAAPLADELRRIVDEIEAIVSPMDDDWASARGGHGEWSVKETLSHLHGADGETFLDGIHRIVREDEPTIDLTPGLTNFNADRRDASTAVLLTAVVAQYRAIADVIEHADDETMNRRAHIELLAQTPYGGHPTLSQWTEAIVKLHLAGHLDCLRRQSA